MERNSPYLKFFNSGKFFAETILAGCVNLDMKIDNFGLGSNGYRILDSVNVVELSIPEELNERTLHLLTASLISLISSSPNNFKLMSYFRAGFTSYGGVLTHTIFSNALNNTYSSFLHTSQDILETAYDASPTYSDARNADRIREWKSFPLERVTPEKHPWFDSYLNSNERKTISQSNLYYLDYLYSVRTYLTLNAFDTTPKLPMLILNMAHSAHSIGLPFTAYGLYLKCLSMQNRFPEMSQICYKGLNRLNSIPKEYPHIEKYIKQCTVFHLFELLWILNDLDTAITNDIEIKMNPIDELYQIPTLDVGLL